MEYFFADDIDLDNDPDYVPEPEPVTGTSKGKALVKPRAATVPKTSTAPPLLGGLDQAMNFDEDDEEQAVLMQASQGMMEERRLDQTPLEKKWNEFRAGGLVAGKNLDLLLWWSQHEKQFPMFQRL